MDIPAHFRIDFRGEAQKEAFVYGPKVRFTVLTERVIRIEYSPNNQFEDRPSQAFWFREQPVPAFTAHTSDDSITIETPALHLQYRITPQGLTPETLQITLRSTGTTWHFGDADQDNLGGTIRTLDDIDGPTPLEPGLVSRSGWAVVDDSRSLVFNEDCWLEPRNAPPGTYDLYFFGYGTDYTACLKDYCALTGSTPIIPRWALGNWWSRYWEYDEAELVQLVEDFKAHEIPLSVVIIDMDWHITETGNTSSGWTGYTWNRKLFPDPNRLLRYLHNQGLRTSMNLHPAEGIHPHEERYPQMARRMGIDPESKQPVPFDIADPAFTRAYFEELHHPEEARGVDFWWIDWQQGTLTKLPGLDPLWWLNHLHFLDLGRKDKRAFIFSRWGGLGNHRYPIGFSGDTYISWQTLDFQPYFTATAANVSYGWWSHDIGGHHLGIEEAELYLRWIQFGVLSPIMRIHATKNPFHDRRPWRYDAETLKLIRRAMQFRHALIPYLYTMAWRDHTRHLPLMRPMYHTHSEHEEAYHCLHQYWFGSELIAAPFTTPRHPETRLSRVVVWLPAGDWYDFHTGEYLAGGRWHAIYGTLDDVPLFAKAGAIVPLAPEVPWGGTELPETLHIHAFAGADGAFTLYEDDGDTPAYQRGQSAQTQIELRWQPNEVSLTVAPPTGDTSLLPQERTFIFHLHGIHEPASVQALVNGTRQEVTSQYDPETDTLHLNEICVTPGDTIQITVTAEEGLQSTRDRRLEKGMRLIRGFALHTAAQHRLADALEDVLENPALLAKFGARLSDAQARALVETLFEVGVEHVPPLDGREHLILWNNLEWADTSYQFAYGVANRLDAEVGSIPKSRVIVPVRDIPTHGHHPAVWRFRANLFDLTTVEHRGKRQ
ncbi:MAG: glycoside hydrolase family 31 protein [Anaerolineae bacterium]